jgi:nicotinamide-nucleotide amidase
MKDNGNGSPRVAILVTGSEIVDGKIRDRNSQIIASRLTQLGVTRIRFGAVGDDAAEFIWYLQAFREAGIRVVFVTGGRGSTQDDGSNQFEAEFTDRRLVTDEDLADRIFALTRTNFERSMSAGSVKATWDRVVAALSPGMSVDEALRDAARKQATLPEGASALSGVGTAPAYCLDVPGYPMIVAFPGPPLEVELLLDHVLELPAVRRILGHVTPRTTTTIRLFGVPEEMLAIVELEAERRGLLDSVPKPSTCYVNGGAELEISMMCTAAEVPHVETFAAFLRSIFGEAMFSTGPTVDQMVADLRGARTVAVADFATAGAVSQRLDQREILVHETAVPSGVNLRTPAELEQIVGVPASALAAGLSENVAYEMATRIRQMLGTDIGVGVAHAEEIYVAVTTRDGLLTRTFGPPPSPYDRESLRIYISTVVLHALHELLHRETGR